MAGKKWWAFPKSRKFEARERFCVESGLALAITRDDGLARFHFWSRMTGFVSTYTSARSFHKGWSACLLLMELLSVRQIGNGGSPNSVATDERNHCNPREERIEPGDITWRYATIRKPFPGTASLVGRQFEVCR
jgi:hypothetical protein